MATPTPEKPRFVAGGTVQAGKGIYVRRHADDHLLELCRQSKFAFVLTSRQMGKSSLMVNTMRALQEEGAKSVSVDLTKLGANLTPEQWYRGFLLITENQLSLDTDASDWWDEHEQLGFTQRLLLFFQEVILKEVPAPTRIVIFVDEIDSVLSLYDKTTGASFNVDDFFAAVRALYNERSINPDLERLTFVLIGVATPTDLVQDARRTPFNIGDRVELDDFTEAQALPLMGGFEVSQVNQDKAAEVLRWVFHWTGGHPFLTQRLCQELANRQIENITKADVDKIVHEVFLGEKAEQVSNISFVRDMLTRPDRIPDGESGLEAVLDTYREILAEKKPVLDEERSQIKSYLKLSGVVRREGQHLKVRNRIYRNVFTDQWVKDHSPETRTAERVRAIRLRYLRATAFALLFALLAIAFLWQWSAAATAKNVAIANERSAREAGEIAKQEREKANRLARLADEAAKQAEAGRAQAETALTAAEKSAEEARKEKANAEQQRIIAEQARLKAEEEKCNATFAKEEAEARRRDAVAALKQALENENIAGQEREKADLTKYAAQDNQVLATKASTKSKSQSSAAAAMQNLRLNPDGSLIAISQAVESMPKPPVNATQAVNKLTMEVSDSIKQYWLDQKANFNDADLDEDALPPPVEAQEALRQALLESRRRVIIDAGQAISGIAYGPRSRHGCEPGADKKVQCGVYVITASDDNKAKIWLVDADAKNDITYHVATLPDHKGQVQWAAFSKQLTDGHYRIVTASYDNTALVYDFDFARLEDEVAKSLELPRHQRDDIVAVKGGAISPIDTLVPPGERRGGELDRLQFAAFDPDGNRVIAASRNGLAYIWEGKEGFLKADTGKCQSGPAGKEATTPQPCVKYGVVQTLKGHKGVLYSAFYSRQGDRIVTASGDNTAIVWNAATGRPLLTLRGHLKRVRQAVFNYDGTEVATAGEDGLAIVWDVKEGSKTYGVRKQVLSGHTGNIWSIAYNSCDPCLEGINANGECIGGRIKINKDCTNEARQQLVTASEDRTARVWNATAGTLIAELRGHTHIIWRAAFSPDGQQVITASEDQTARIWDTNKERRLAEFKAGDEPVWLIYGPEHKDRPRQHLVATVGQTGYPSLWDADTGESLGNLQPEAEKPRPGPLRRWFNQMLSWFKTKEPPAAKCAQGDAADKKSLDWRPLLAWNERYFVAVNIDCAPDRWRLRIWDVDTGTYKPRKWPAAEHFLANAQTGKSGQVQRIHLVKGAAGQDDELVLIYESGHVEFRELCNGQVIATSKLKEKLARDKATIVATNRAGTYVLTEAAGKLRRLNSQTLAEDDQTAAFPDIAADTPIACNNDCTKALIVAKGSLWEVKFDGTPPAPLETNPNDAETVIEIRRADYVTTMTEQGNQQEYVLAVIKYWRKPGNNEAVPPAQEHYHAVKVLDAARKPTSVLRGHVNPIMLAIPDFTGKRVLTASADGWVRISPDVLFKDFKAVTVEAEEEREKKHHVSVSKKE